jgi:dGTP triphosphohydrolase
MSEVTALTLEAFAERVERLEEFISTQVTPRFDDIQDGHAGLFGRIDLYFADLQKQINTLRADLEDKLKKEHTILSDDVNKLFAKLLAESRVLLEEMRQQFVEKVRERIQAVTSDEIAEALSRKILIIRNATRDELNNPDVLKVRHASLGELHNRN